MLTNRCIQKFSAYQSKVDIIFIEKQESLLFSRLLKYLLGVLLPRPEVEMQNWVFTTIVLNEKFIFYRREQNNKTNKRIK